MSNSDSRDGRVPTMLEALAKAGYDDVLVLDRESVGFVFTDRRTELVELIEDGEGLSVGEIAEALDREQSAVSRDLDVLFEYSVIDYEREGRRKIPFLRHETILQEPLP